MISYKLGEVEMRFADIIWQNAPLTTRELVALAEVELTWNRSTTYTILGRLCEKGLFVKEGKVVSIAMTKEELLSAQSEKFVEDTFEGSLPSFLAAFSRKKPLSDAQINELQDFIDAHRKG